MRGLVLAGFIFFAFNTASAVGLSTTTGAIPIVLVSGIVGWGPEEMAGIPYWGGPLPSHNIANALSAKGAQVFTASVGPFSSNWDRAIELYYQIKGGCVDYGLAHTQKYGHARFGKCYPGFYPEWDAGHPIHLIGHSLGGLTTRTLVALLETGNANEIAASGATVAELFKGHNSWVLSVTTVSTPHDGCTIASDTRLMSFARDFIVSVASLSSDNIGSASDPIYDFKLDQWGLQRNSGESWNHYADRVFQSPLWGQEKDFGIYDLSLAGATDLNAWVKTYPDVYYFSISTEDTHTSLLDGAQSPDLLMSPLLIGTGLWIGQSQNPEWAVNDGLANREGMDGPISQPQQEFTGGVPQPGIWNHLLNLQGWDHIQVIGFCLFCDSNQTYIDHWQLLQSLPKPN